MGLFKNDVGRPSNDIKRKRKIIVFLLVSIFIIPLVGFLIASKNTSDLKANIKKNNEFEVYAYTKLPSTPNYSIKDPEEKKKGNRTFNLQDFDIYDGFIYFSKQSRGSCLETDPDECNDLLKQVTIYRTKYDSKNESKFYEQKDFDKMILNNSGHGTVFNHISSKTKTYMIAGISELDDNNGLRKWKEKYIGTSKYFGLITFVKNKKANVYTRAKKDKYKAIINQTEDKITYSKYIYDIGVDENQELLSVRNNNNVYVYNYSFETGRLELGVPKYTINVDNGGKQGHDIYKDNIYVLYNDKLMTYNYKNDKSKTFKLDKKDVEKASEELMNKYKDKSKISKYEMSGYEFEGVKVIEGKIYIGCKVAMKEYKNNKATTKKKNKTTTTPVSPETTYYSFIFEFNQEIN